MSFFFIFVGIFILILIIYYFSINTECFENRYSPEQIKSLSNTEISNIKNNYDILKQTYSAGYKSTDIKALEIKEKIKKSFIKIEELLVNTNDKYLLLDVYYGNFKKQEDYKSIFKYLDEINDIEFYKLMDKVNLIIINATSDNNYKSNQTINQITNDFNNLNDLYKNVYINNLYSYNDKRSEINDLILKIVTELTTITTHDNIYNSGIILILNTTLKRAYETNNLLEINNNINSFNEKIRIIQSQIITPNPNITTTNPVYNYGQSSPLTINNIKDDFNNINNAFELINNTYKNNMQNKELFIANLNNIIYYSIDNIANYYVNNNEYKNKVNSIKNAFIKPILEMELKDSYNLNDVSKIINVKKKFYNNIDELKNIIVSINTKTSNINGELCLYNILNAVKVNNYPINVSNINHCDKSLFNDKDIILQKPL